MDKLCVVAALAVLAGCASSQPEPQSPSAAIAPDSAAIAQLASSAAFVDLADPENRVTTVCKDRVVTGSHLIRGVECTIPVTRDPTLLEKLAAEQTDRDIREYQRRAQDALLRSQNDELRRSFGRR